MNTVTKQSLHKSFHHWRRPLLSVLLSAAILPQASAHLMVAQHGTLNFKGGSVFMVLSLPVSAFEAIDDDGDGKMSSVEFAKHRISIAVTVKERVKLADEKGVKILQGLMLSPVTPHLVAKAHSKQLVIMGRFILAGVDSAQDDKLKFQVGLFGKAADEKSFKLTATRKKNADSKPEKYKFVLTPEQFESQLFAN